LLNLTSHIVAQDTASFGQAEKLLQGSLIPAAYRAKVFILREMSKLRLNRDRLPQEPIQTNFVTSKKVKCSELKF